MLCLVVFKGRRTENLKLKLELVKIKYEMITVRNIVNEKYTFPIRSEEHTSELQSR